MRVRMFRYINLPVNNFLFYCSSNSPLSRWVVLIVIIHQFLVLNLLKNGLLRVILILIMGMDTSFFDRFTKGIFLAGLEIAQLFVYVSLVEVGFISTHIEFFSLVVFWVFVDDSVFCIWRLLINTYRVIPHLILQEKLSRFPKLDECFAMHQIRLGVYKRLTHPLFHSIFLLRFINQFGVIWVS